VGTTAETEKLNQLLAKFPRLSVENQQYITGLIKGLKHAQKTTGTPEHAGRTEKPRQDTRTE
jgi:hypothetical protein